MGLSAVVEWLTGEELLGAGVEELHATEAARSGLIELTEAATRLRLRTFR